MFLKEIRNNFCVSDTNFASARASKQRSICVRNIVSSFAAALRFEKLYSYSKISYSQSDLKVPNIYARRASAFA